MEQRHGLPIRKFIWNYALVRLGEFSSLEYDLKEIKGKWYWRRAEDDMFSQPFEDNAYAILGMQRELDTEGFLVWRPANEREIE